MKENKIYEDENGYIYPFEGKYKIFWKNEKFKLFKPEVDIKFTKFYEAYFYLRSVNV